MIWFLIAKSLYLIKWFTHSLIPQAILYKKLCLLWQKEITYLPRKCLTLWPFYPFYLFLNFSNKIETGSKKSWVENVERNFALFSHSAAQGYDRYSDCFLSVLRSNFSLWTIIRMKLKTFYFTFIFSHRVFVITCLSVLQTPEISSTTNLSTAT